MEEEGMTVEATGKKVGWRVYGAGVMALGALCLVWGTFDPGQPVPGDFPHRAALARGAALVMLIAGAAVMWRWSASRGAAVLVAYYAFVVVLLMYGRMLLVHAAEFLTYEGLAIQLAIAVGALLVYAAGADEPVVPAVHLIRVGQRIFALCVMVFGTAHFLYMNLTAPLVPAWLPPAQEFWAFATGVAQIAAGVAILTGLRARLAAMLLTAMYASFSLLVHGPMLLADPSNHYIWTENASNIALIGAAWVVSDSLPRPAR
jgi:uncharacterized membrane protein YphA (DoxX/SURF4 family)